MKNYFPSPFDIDVSLNGGYLYTTQARLSSIVANHRLTLATFESVQLKNKKVIDIGCGDGVYTFELYKNSQPRKLYGIDSSKQAVKLAKMFYGRFKNIKFFHADLYNMPKNLANFDLALVRGVIHHLPNPETAIKAIGEICDEILILEPNGYNPLLKMIERISPYHRFHKEKSYPPKKIRYWLEKAGFNVRLQKYISIVPFFFPDILTVIFKIFEPFVEKLPYLRNIICGVYVAYAKKEESSPTQSLRLQRRTSNVSL